MSEYRCKGCGATMTVHSVSGTEHHRKLDNARGYVWCGPVVEYVRTNVEERKLIDYLDRQIAAGAATPIQHTYPEPSWQAPTDDVEGDAACQ